MASPSSTLTMIPRSDFQVLEECLTLALTLKHVLGPSDRSHTCQRLCLRLTFLMLHSRECPFSRFWEIHSLHKSLCEYLKRHQPQLLDLNLDQYRAPSQPQV